MNPELNLLQPYPFQKLGELLANTTPAPHSSPISLSIGEPRHPAPQIVLDAYAEALPEVEKYPSTKGSQALRESIARWLASRFTLANPERLADGNIIPVNGTREGLFAIAQCLLSRTSRAVNVLMPNPFYQIYEGAVLLAGCKPDFYDIDNNADLNLEAISTERFDNSQLIYICTPGNPTGAVNSAPALQQLIEKAHKHDFIIVSDECYSEVYRETPGAPCGLLQASAAMGNDDFSRCLAFHSLSKRSNLPGLRSGFVAGDASLIQRFVDYRTYQGCAMSGAVQCASIAAWSDESHVDVNRRLYDAKYRAVLNVLSPVLSLNIPPAGFYLWPELPVDDKRFTQALLGEYNVRVVPGSFLARATSDSENPGKNHLRLALVASLEDCVIAAERIVDCLSSTEPPGVA